MADWMSAYLKAGGYPDTPQNRAFLSTWQRFEGGHTNNNARFNYMNTTWSAPGAKSINSVGVKAYGSLAQGASAWAATLKHNRNYAGLDASLRAGNPYTKASVPGLSTWLSGSPSSSSGLSYASRVLGTKLAPAPAGAPQGGGAAPAILGSAAGPSALEALRTMTSSALLAQSTATAAGQLPDMTGLLALATARRALLSQGTGQAAPAPSPASPGGPTSTVPVKGLALQVRGQYGQENPHFLSALTAAAKARGAVAIQVTSGERTPQHNAAVGGASHSNHLPDAQGFGHALDGYAVLPNGTKVPLGQFLLPVAAKYGLRSGATFQWGGHPDVVHVDDGFNQR